MRKIRGGRCPALQREHQLLRPDGRGLVRIIGIVFLLVVAVVGDAVRRAESLEVGTQTLPVALADLMAARIGGAVARREMRELLLDEREVTLPRRRLKAKRARAEVRRIRRGDGAHERLEEVRSVGDARQYG